MLKKDAPRTALGLLSRLGLVLLLLLVFAAPAAAGINLVNSGISPGTAVSNTFTVSGLSTGDYNTVVVVIALSTPGAIISTNPPVADSGGSSYFKYADVTANSTSSRVVIYSTAPGASVNSTSVTVKLACCTSSDMVVAVASYSGVASLGKTATTTVNASGTTTKASISVTTSDASNWVVAGFAAAGASAFTQDTGTIERQAIANASVGGALTDNTGPVGTVNNIVQVPGGPEWTAMAALELRTAPSPSLLTTSNQGGIGGTSGTSCGMGVPGGRIGDTIVVVVATNPATSVASISDNATPTSSSYTFRQAVNSPGSNTRVEIWTATLASNFIWSTSVTAQLSSSGTAHRACAAAVYAGVTGGIGTTSTASGTTANPSVPLTMGAANNVVVAGFATQGTTLPTQLTGNLRRTVASSGGSGSANATATLTDNTATSPISVTNAVTLVAGQWAAVAVELKTKTCGTVTDPTYVAANAQIATGQTNVYWSSPTYPNVIVVRKPGKFAGEVPNNYQNYAAGSAPGGSLGTAAVSYVGSATSDPETPGAGNYYYKVFAYDTSAGPTCYSSGAINTTDGVSANTSPSATQEAWSYAIAGGSTLAASIAGSGTLYTSSNAGRILSLNTANGTQSWSPTATNINTTVQSWLSWIPVSWADSTYPYRMPLTITAGAAAPPSGYSVPVTFNHASLVAAGKSQASGNDVRVFYWNGTAWVQLDRVLDSGSAWNTATTKIWFKTQAAIAASGTDQNYFLHYGNLSAVNPPANKANVFLFADDFEAGNLNNWTTFNGGTWAVDGTVSHTGSSSLKYANDSTAANRWLLANPALNQANIYWEAWWRFDVVNAATDTPDNAQVFRADSSGNAYEVNLESNGSVELWDMTEWDLNNWYRVNPQPSPVNPPASTWTRIGIAISGNPGMMRVFKDGAQINPTSGAWNVTSCSPTACPSPALTSGNVGFRRFSAGATGRDTWWIDDVVARLYVDPEPTSALGAEQASTGAAVIGGDLGTATNNTATVYFVDSGSGAKTWTSSSSVLTGNGADAIQAAASAQLYAYSNAAFQSAYQGVGYFGDVVFVATRNSRLTRTGNTVYALKATDGTRLWNFNASTTYSVDDILGEPYVDYNRNLLYVASKAGASNNQNNLWIIDTRNGTVVQQLALGTNHIQTSPTLSYGGNTLYVADVNGNLYAVNLTACTSGASCTATLKWTAPAALGSAIKDTGFVWEDYTTPGRLYFSTANGNVWCWQDPGVGATPNVATACSGWSAVKTAVAGASTPLLLNKLFVSSWDGTTGKISQICLSTPCITGFNPGQVEKSVTVGDGTKQPGDVSSETGNEIFVGTSDGKIFKYTLTGGSL